MNKTGYHGTCSKYRHSIEENGLDPSKSKYRTNHWLGQGVYFFDDYIKADWWASNVSHKNGDCGKLIYQSIIVAPDEEVLDLDDNSQLDYFITETLNTIEEIEKECQGKMPVINNYETLRALFFDYFKKSKNISVIIGTFQKDVAGYTTTRYRDELKKQKKIMSIIGIKFNERQICVSKKECIKSTDLIYNENEEEVI